MSQNFPLFLYLYDEKGRYGQPSETANSTELERAMLGPVRDHIRQRLESRITNCLEELVFRSRKGEIL